MRIQRAVLVVLAVGLGCAAPQAPPVAPVAPPPAVAPPADPGPERDDFESAAEGSLPPGWAISGPIKDIRFAAARSGGGTVLEIVTTGDGSGTIKRPLDVARYRGKRLLVSARGSCEPASRRARATVGIDVTRSAERGYADRARTDEIETAAWQDYRTLVDVAGDATALDLVITAGSASTIRIDDITVRVLGAAGAGDEPPAALDGRGLDNVVAFARLYGLVRYFHPSDEAAALDEAAWNRFVVRGVRVVETAASAEALAARLAALVAPIAPTVAVHVEGAPAPAIEPVSGPAVHWIHDGVGLSKGSIYTSVRGAIAPWDVATITTAIDPALVRGKELKVVLRARGKPATPLSDAGLWISEQRPEGKPGFVTEPAQQPAIGETWTEIPIAARISDDATGLTLGVQVIAGAEVWFEPPAVTVDGKPLAIAGWGAAGKPLAPAWTADAGRFTVALGDKPCARRRTCLHVRPGADPPPDLRPWSGALGGGVAAVVPLELPIRDGKTVPPVVPSPSGTATLPAPDPVPLVASDRATRLAAVIIAWNVFEHFYPYFDVAGTDWMAELPLRLGEAARDDGPAALHRTLRRLVHDLHDGHGIVLHGGEDLSWTAPWRWQRVEGALAITQVADACGCDLAAGDVVTAIDGVPVEQAFASVAELTSAATEQFLTWKVLRTLRSGPEGGRRRIAVERGGATHEVEAALVAPAAALDEHRPASGAELAPGVRYVDIDTLTMEQWTRILPELAAARAVVVDMRSYPNHIGLSEPTQHFSKRPVTSPQWHVPIPARPDREGMGFEISGWTLKPAEPYIGNAVFLTDGSAVSAAETFMAIVDHHKLGPIVGSATAGTNGNINPFTLPGGYLLWWTGMKVLEQDGRRHHGVGIQPTVPAERTLAGVAAGRDEVLEAGIAAANRLIQAPPRRRRR